MGVGECGDWLGEMSGEVVEKGRLLELLRRAGFFVGRGGGV